ncbi:MAG: hypothetical protein FJ095_07425 [Deltaproteobacteria bacterium]|nr:hypothetical protein [Deltaproteobacteria bacterium]
MKDALAVVFAVTLALVSGRAAAIKPVPSPAAPPAETSVRAEVRGLDVAISGVFGEHSFSAGGFTEVTVSLRNRGQELQRGTVSVLAGRDFRGRSVGLVEAPFEVAPSGAVELLVPTGVSFVGDPVVAVRDEAGKLLLERSLGRQSGDGALLVELGQRSALATHLDGAVLDLGHPVVFDRANPHPYLSPSGSARLLPLSLAPVPNVTLSGEPVAPRVSASYARVAAVLARSDALVRLGAPELSALAGWLLSGGTLALAISRPEDLRHPTVVALLGGELAEGPVDGVTLARLPALPSAPRTPSGTESGKKELPVDPPVSPTLSAVLIGHRGGNVSPSPFGSTAVYGLGEVHVLPFDPTARPAVDEPWVHVRLAAMAARSLQRRLSMLARPGDFGGEGEAVGVRRYLDPNEGSRWAIVFAVLLLCGYAIAAGPINFFVWRRRGAPLRALSTLGVLSATTFGGVAILAVAVKGVKERARHLTFVDAGAGMSMGAAHRYRGFFSHRARSLSVEARHAAGLVRSDGVDPFDSDERWRLERDRHRLVGIELRPWQTHVVREDGVASLGAGIALVRGSDDEVTVVNRSGRALLGLMLHRPGKTPGWLARLEHGARARHGDLEAFSVRRAHFFGGLKVSSLDLLVNEETLDTRLPGLGAAWRALADRFGDAADVFPEDVPVLLAQLDGGEGITEDLGMRVEHDRTLVRVVGYGGEP